MKKFLALLATAFIVVSALSANPGVKVSPFAAIDVGVNNYIRGGSAGGQLLYDFGGLALGLEAKFGYDMTYNNAHVPLLAVLGLGPDFYILAGQTFGLGDPYLKGSDGSVWNYRYAGLLNTYGLGIKYLRTDLGFGSFAVGNEISYTSATPVTGDPTVAAFGMLGAVLAGLKAEVYGSVELSF
jgi:hypothetical protein